MIWIMPNPELVNKLDDHLTRTEVDYTIFFRELSNGKIKRFDDFWEMIIKTSYLDQSNLSLHKKMWEEWFLIYENNINLEKS